jgi:hypothetical protein
MGAGGDLNHAEVKAICNSLECSPSQHDASGFQGGAPNIEPTAKSSTSANGKTTLPTHTSEFQMKDRSATLPNYKKRFAPKPQHV